MDEKKDNPTKIPIHLESALDRTGNDEEFLYELINIYVDDYEEKYQELKSAIEQEDYSQIQEIGHSLKGSSANLSLTYMQAASLDMEMAGREKNIKQAEEALNKLKAEFEVVKEYFADKLN
ncbi:MAG: Hpt domain-containing protein [Candidatus Aminicenantes bacterium]|nr:Hpt domain-containing protein [Candidatus Aminicenantes bacterium]